MGYLRKRFSTAAGVATTLLLLALPSLASANPGNGPELVQRSGRLVVLHADRYDGTSTEQWMLVNGAKHVAVHAPDDVWITPGTPVRLEGTMVGDTLTLADSETAVKETGVAPMLAVASDTASAPAIHTAAVILVQFSTGGTWAGMGVDKTAAANVVGTNVNAYYQEQTYGQIGFTATGYGPYTIAGNPSNCLTESQNWMTSAMQAAGVGPGDYQHVVVAFPTLPPMTCPWSGQAQIGGTGVWVNGAPTLRVLAHELGHNLGIGHAGGLACTGAPISTSCSTPDPYGDPFDPMGGYSGPVRQMNMEHKLALNLLPASAVKVVGVSGTYHVAPMETLSGTPELLRIPKVGGGNYYVEYRYPIGAFDSQAPALQGVLVRTEGTQPSPVSPNAPDTLLIDMHPATPSVWTDAAMDVGQVFSDPIAGVSITNLGQDANGATLAISGPQDVVPPNAPTALTAVASGTSAILHWTAATDNYEVDSYVVKRDGVVIAGPTGTDFQDSNLVPGTTVTYSVAAVDAGNNVGPEATASVVMPDTAAPAASAKVTAKLTRDGKVHVSWAAAADNGRVSFYRVLRGGKAIATATATALAYVDKAPKTGGGSTVTYSVVAIDLAGNVGPPGKAKPLRSALLRTLAATGLTATRTTAGIRVKGKVSDAQARCRLRIGRGVWHPCKAKLSGVFAVTLAAKGRTPVTLSLRNSLGRVKTQTLRVR
jgi:hypothetical protein